MRSEEFQKVCQSVESGSDMRVRHIILHQVGKVVACHPDDFVEVELDSGEHKTWSKENLKLLQ